MAIDNENVELRFDNIVVDEPIDVNIKCYSADDVRVFYGLGRTAAVFNTDFTVELNPADYNTFDVIPTQSLRDKIDAMLLADEDEEDCIFVARELNYLSDFVEADGFLRDKIAKEFDRTLMRTQQIALMAEKSLDVLPGAVAAATTATTQAGIATGAASTATTKAGEASDSADDAYAWANEDEDVVVADGKYSAFHWAQKAYGVVSAALTDIANALGAALADITSAKNSAISELDDYVAAAEAWAESEVEVEPGKYSAKYHAERAEAIVDGAAFELLENKGQPDGYASLDSGGKVPASQLPSYVDDAVEAANFAALPGTGETGKIYVTLDDNKTYRWSGSAYVEISASPGSTDAVPEGATNLYHTAARVRATVLTGLSTAAATVVDATHTVLQAIGFLQAQISAIAFPTKAIGGFTVAVNVTDSSHDHDIAAGWWIESGVKYVGTAMTKQTDADWAAGTNAGGRQTALGNSALCHWLAIYHPTNGVDYMCKPVATAISLPAGYTQYKHIRYFRTDGSGNIVPDYQDPLNPDEVWLNAGIAEWDVTNTTTTAVTVTSAAPPNVDAIIATSLDGSGGTSTSAMGGSNVYGSVRPISETDAAPTQANSDICSGLLSWAITSSGGAYGPTITTYAWDGIIAACRLYVRTDANKQYRYRKTGSNGNCTFKGTLLGWRDRRLA